MRVTIVCAECGTRETAAPSAVATVLTRHNNLHHDGAPVAEVVTAEVPA